MSQAIIPTVVTQVVATISGAIVSVGIPLVLTKLNKINKLHTTVFGLQEVSSVGGLVQNVESNTDKITTLEEGQSKIDTKQDKIITALNSLEEKIDDTSLSSERLDNNVDQGNSISDLGESLDNDSGD